MMRVTVVGNRHVYATDFPMIIIFINTKRFLSVPFLFLFLRRSFLFVLILQFTLSPLSSYPRRLHIFPIGRSDKKSVYPSANIQKVEYHYANVIFSFSLLPPPLNGTLEKCVSSFSRSI